ncbi:MULTISPECIES: hypothetical protein [Klebsiella]|nr:hypothetical protein [Klebsiella pasteurii]MDX7156946.1 hypothetical protein [Klebsiella pasteurii]
MFTFSLVVINILISIMKIMEIIKLMNDRVASAQANAAPALKNPPASLFLTLRETNTISSQGYKESSVPIIRL